MKRIVLDTSAYRAFFAGDSRVLDAIVESETVLFSSVVAGELYAAFRGGSRYQKNRDELSRFLRKPQVEVLEVGLETAEVFGQVKSGLKAAGAPIPINDLWIASQCIETGAVLVSFDRHFRSVPGLRFWEPLREME